jgi:putative FmdB family regulatory protein
MPNYEFRCESCQEIFSRKLSMKERTGAKVPCPQCSDERVTPIISTFTARTSRKS